MKTDILKCIKSFIFPERCVLCGKVLNDRKIICQVCKASLHFCEENPVIKRIMLSQNGKRYLFSVYSPFYYDGSIRRGILSLKFRSRKKVTDFFTPYMVNTARGDSFKKADFTICVPSSKERERQRGFNQSEILAKAFSEISGIMYYENVLKKTKDTVSQSLMKNSKERAENVRGVFSINSDADIKGKRIVLIDDVFTTGATLKECCDILIDSGALSVTCITAASKRQYR